MSETTINTAPVPPEEPASTTDVLSAETLRLKLDEFEGPFEVLLYLIKEQEIDIFDIPIVQVTEQYLQFLDLLRAEQIDVAGDFLVLAATLIQIKSRMILPPEVEVDEDEEIEEEDPRLELVVKLLEYRKYRDLARLLGDREEKQADMFGRRVKPQLEQADADEEDFLEVSLYDLTKAVRAMLRFLMGESAHNVLLESASVDEKIAHIEALLGETESLSWSELTDACENTIEKVCCLLAILELCRMYRIRAHQHGEFGEIRLFARQDGDRPDTETAAETHVAIS
ncbi:MAG TPA: segregation/condensation protein A [Candidatus Hydrogenedentes bacterium]|nr:segregation/condensation protein A [Candidatus Hydrogenedentota bacterium]